MNTIKPRHRPPPPIRGSSNSSATVTSSSPMPSRRRRSHPIRQKFDELMERRVKEVQQTNPNATHVEIKRTLEQDSVFEKLMDNPPVFEIARRAIGPDITLATGGESDYRLPHATSLHQLAQRFPVDGEHALPAAGLLDPLHVFPGRRH